MSPMEQAWALTHCSIFSFRFRAHPQGLPEKFSWMRAELPRAKSESHVVGPGGESRVLNLMVEVLFRMVPEQQML